MPKIELTNEEINNLIIILKKSKLGLSYEESVKAIQPILVKLDKSLLEENNEKENNNQENN